MFLHLPQAQDPDTVQEKPSAFAFKVVPRLFTTHPQLRTLKCRGQLRIPYNTFPLTKALIVETFGKNKNIFVSPIASFVNHCFSLCIYEKSMRQLFCTQTSNHKYSLFSFWNSIHLIFHILFTCPFFFLSSCYSYPLPPPSSLSLCCLSLPPPPSLSLSISLSLSLSLQ